MKKLTLLALIIGLSGTAAFAQQGGFKGPGAVEPQTNQTTEVKPDGFSNPNASVTTVEQARQLKDDAWVTLRGNIIEQVGKKKYRFRDETGTIDLEIDRKYWNGITVTPSDKIELQGEVDKDWNSIEIDVKKITKLN